MSQGPAATSGLRNAPELLAQSDIRRDCVAAQRTIYSPASLTDNESAEHSTSLSDPTGLSRGDQLCMSSVKLGVGGNPAGGVNQRNNRRDPETRNTGRQNQRQVQIVTDSHGRSDVRSNPQRSDHNGKQID